ncbi:MAG: hypothetical protein ACRYGB_05705 [Janthinobacterium lividum]
MKNLQKDGDILSEKKERLAKSIEMLIVKSYSEDEDGFWAFVEKISQKAAEKGLTEKELNRILNEG